MFRSALADPCTFYIGIDANSKPLQKVSIKAERAFRKERCVNAMFVRASAEHLPGELYGTADFASINFPWGSLLGAVLRPDASFLSTLQQILRPGGELSLVTGIDPEKDRNELARLGLERISGSALADRIRESYSAAGFTCVDVKETRDPGRLPETTWARKLRTSGSRTLLTLSCRSQRKILE